MPWIYICEDCGKRTYPEKRLEDDECPLCEGHIEPKYVCKQCKHRIGPDDIKNYECPNCGAPIPKDEVAKASSDKVVAPEKGTFDNVTMKGDEINIELEDNEIVSMEGVEEVNLNFSDEDIGNIVNPDSAEFHTVKECEKDGESATLYFKGMMHFESKEKEEILKKIKEMDWFAGSSTNR